MKISWMGLVRLFFQVNVLVAITLVVLLSTGCLNPSKPVEKIKIIRVTIPDNLLVTCPKPTLNGEKSSDVAVYAVKVTDQLKICNSRILQIKSLVKDYEHEIEQDAHSEFQSLGFEKENGDHHSDKGRINGKGRGR